MNKCIIIGNVTADIELQNKKKLDYARFSVAVNRYNEGTDFFKVVVFGEQAKNCAKYLKKGSKVAVFGAMQLDEYITKNGDKAVAASLIAHSVEFLQSAK